MSKSFKSVTRVLALLSCVVLLVIGLSTMASAASYPLVISDLESSITIPEGKVGQFKMTILPEYHNEKYNVEIYDSSGSLVGSASSSYYNSDGTFIKNVTITIDTKKLDMGVGTYKIKYWLSFYSLYEWHNAPNKYTYTLKVIKDTCKGNHNIVDERVVTEGTCKKEGTYKVKCTKCEYEAYEKRLGAHTYGLGTPADAATHLCTCTLCGATSNEKHTWDKGKATNPTIKGTTVTHGYTTFTCTECDYERVENYTFPDVRNKEWYYKAVEFSVAKGFFSGHGNGTFGPGNGITRQDFVVVLARIAGADLSKYSGVTNFKDVSSKAYYAKAIHWASSNNVVAGYNSEKFGVDDKITREQLVTILYRYAMKKGYNISVTGNAMTKLNAFGDANKISAYSKPACAWALEKGVLSGKSATSFDPTGAATRAQVATILMNISLKKIMPI